MSKQLLRDLEEMGIPVGPKSWAHRRIFSPLVYATAQDSDIVPQWARDRAYETKRLRDTYRHYAALLLRVEQQRRRSAILDAHLSRSKGEKIGDSLRRVAIEFNISAERVRQICTHEQFKRSLSSYERTTATPETLQRTLRLLLK